jgi:hypothetical protein
MKEIDIHTPGTRLVTVYRVADSVTAELIRNSLRDEGIPCELGGERQAGFTGVLDVEVIVRREDRDRALQVINRLFPRHS